MHFLLISFAIKSEMYSLVGTTCRTFHEKLHQDRSAAAWSVTFTHTSLVCQKGFEEQLFAASAAAAEQRLIDLSPQGLANQVWPFAKRMSKASSCLQHGQLQLSNACEI